MARQTLHALLHNKHALAELHGARLYMNQASPSRTTHGTGLPCVSEATCKPGACNALSPQHAQILSCTMTDPEAAPSPDAISHKAARHPGCTQQVAPAALGRGLHHASHAGAQRTRRRPAQADPVWAFEQHADVTQPGLAVGV